MRRSIVELAGACFAAEAALYDFLAVDEVA